MRKLRVMVLLDPRLVPPDDLVDRADPRVEKFQTELDVKAALQELGHKVRMVGVYDDLGPIRQTIDQWKPHIAFNLMEDFAGNGALDYYVVSYLDMINVPYTGCNPRGLVLSRDKALSKKILAYHKIRVPKFMVFPRDKSVKPERIAKLPYPLIVKSLIEQGSVGIAQTSYVTTPEELTERVRQVHQLTGGDAIAEQYIDGRELYVTVMGNRRLEVLPVRELVFGKLDDPSKRIATYKVKWDPDYREGLGIDYYFARNLPKGMAEYIPRLAKRIYRILELTSYARMDLRLDREGRIYVLEANPNAAIASNEDVAFAAEKAGMSYTQLIQRIINMGLRAHATRRTT